MKQIAFTVILLFLMAISLRSQTIDLEKTYEITGKAKRGALANVEYNADNGYTLTYVTKSNEQMAKFQIYHFDKDFNFVNMEEDEQEFEKAKVKYKWFKFKGEEYSVEGVYVEPNLAGNLVLRRKQISYKYDWLFLGYYTTTKVLEKVKPKSEDGNKFFYYTHAEDDVTGDVIILTGDRNIKEPFGFEKHFNVLRFNRDLDLVKQTKFDNQYPQSLAFARTLTKDNPDDPDNPLFDGMVFVFAPHGGPGMGKYENENKNAYSYVRINSDLEVVDNIPFESFSSYWKIDELIRDDKDNIYLYGPSAAGKDKYFIMSTNVTKFKAVQLMKIANHKVEYFTETNLEEFAAKLKKPASQKKAPEYEGKKFEIANYYIGSNDDFFVIGQNYNTSKEGNKYSDVIGFQFDNQGKLKAQYGIDTKESNKYAKAAGAPQALQQGSDGSSMYWLLLEIRGVTFFKNKPLTYPRIGRIDPVNGTISDFLDVRGPDDDYYLDAKFPYLESSEGNMITFFGSDKPGKKIWFVRIKI